MFLHGRNYSTGRQFVEDVLAWRPDGKYLASGGHDDKKLCIWDVEGKLQWSQDHGGMRSLAWKPDSTQLAVITNSYPNFLLFSADGQRLTEPPQRVDVDRCVWEPNERQIAAFTDKSSRPNEIYLFNVATNSYVKVMVLLQGGKPATFSTTGELLDGDPTVVDREFFYLAEFADGQTKVMKPSAFIRMANEALASGTAAQPPLATGVGTNEETSLNGIAR